MQNMPQTSIKIFKMPKVLILLGAIMPISYFLMLYGYIQQGFKRIKYKNG